MQTDTAKSSKVKLMAIYAGGGFGLGKRGTPAGASFTMVLSNKWGAAISYKHRIMAAGKQPGDYSPGTSPSSSLYSGPIFSSGNSNAAKDPLVDIFSVFSFVLLREGTTPNKRIRFGIEAGPSLVRSNIITFTKRTVVIIPGGLYGSGSSSNYYTDNQFQQSTGLSLRGKMAFPLVDICGIELAIYANINKVRSFAGVELYLMLGMLGKEGTPYSIQPKI